MKNWKFHFSIIALCFIQGFSCQSLVLTPTKAYVDINETFTLTCTYIGYINVGGTKWNVDNKSTPTIVRHQDNTCIGSGILADDNICRVGCPSDTSFTVTILRVQQEDLNIPWYCFDRDRKSNTVKILLKESVSTDIMITPKAVDDIEGSNVSFRCVHNGTGLRMVWQRKDQSDICVFTTHDCSALITTQDRTTCTCEKSSKDKTTVSFQIPNISSADHNTTLFCAVVYLTEIRNQTATVMVKVPVKTLTITPSEKFIQISENKTTTFTCNTSYSRPIPEILWILKDRGHLKLTGEQTNKSNIIGLTSAESTLNYKPSRTYNGWKLYCVVIKSELQKEEISSSLITLNVTYPPTIHTSENMTLVEGDHLNLSCAATHGNPKETVFLWSSEKNMTWSSQYLTIRNISREDEMNYICSVYNIMTPTGKAPVKGTDSKIFHLSVQYYATVKDFFVNGYKSKRNVTANEYENVTFICDIDSKPISNTSLRLTTDKTLVWTYSNILNYTLGSAKCTEAGTYFCFGKNKLNIGVGSKEHLNLFIRCSPRANPKVSYTANLTLASNVTAVLYFPILAYPKPESVIWQKYSMSNWISLTSNNNINISNNELNVRLSIYKMMETDFGRYRLIISNDVGSYIQDYYINAEDRPNPPTGFRVLNKLTTATTATVQWFPSFNGGQPQHFVLNYSKSLQKHWTHGEIEDTGEPVLIYTINGLSSNSVYYIFLYSVNILGSSKLSARLTLKTKEGMHIDGNTSGVWTTIGICFGALLFLLLLFIGIYALRRFKLTYQDTSKNLHQDTIGSSTQNINFATEYESIALDAVGANIQPNGPTCTGTSTEVLQQNPYEKLDNILNGSNQYSELKPMDGNRDDVFRKRNSDTAPETLQEDLDKAMYMNMKI